MLFFVFIVEVVRLLFSCVCVLLCEPNIFNTHFKRITNNKTTKTLMKLKKSNSFLQIGKAKLLGRITVTRAKRDALTRILLLDFPVDSKIKGHHCALQPFSKHH